MHASARTIPTLSISQQVKLDRLARAQALMYHTLQSSLQCLVNPVITWYRMQHVLPIRTQKETVKLVMSTKGEQSRPPNCDIYRIRTLIHSLQAQDSFLWRVRRFRRYPFAKSPRAHAICHPIANEEDSPFKLLVLLTNAQPSGPSFTTFLSCLRFSFQACHPGEFWADSDTSDNFVERVKEFECESVVDSVGEKRND